MRITQILIFSLVCLVISTNVGATFYGWESQEGLPDSFIAEYEILKSGLRVGKSTAKLSVNGTHGEYEVVSKATGMAKYFTDNANKKEKVLFEVDNTYLKPNIFQSTIGSDTLKEKYQYDWANRNLVVLDEGATTELSLDKYRIDKFTLQLFLMQNPLEVNQEKEYFIVSDGEKSTQIYKNKGEFKIDTKLGSQLTYLIERVKDNEKNTTYRSWYSKGLQNIPVKIERLEYGKPVLTILIKNVKWLDNLSE